MNWNTTGGATTNDNLQVFIVFKDTDTSRASDIKDGIFGNDDGEWERFVAYKGNSVMVSGISVGCRSQKNL